jgi:aryl-alcohol dehydrogenase-like predicted oxidoreductase
VETVRLGRTGVEVPRIALGTWGHGGPKMVGKHPVGWSGYDSEAARGALALAYDRGLTHWDTADVYGDGQAERSIGSLWGPVPRAQIFLASKVGWDAGPYDHFYHPEQIRQQLEHSLVNLKTDYLDLYYLHHCNFGPNDEYLDDAVALLRRFRDEGMIRFIGLSDWKAGKVARYAQRVDPDVVQPYRNVVDDSWEASGLRAWVEEKDAGVALVYPHNQWRRLGHDREPPVFGDGDHRSRIPGFRDPDQLAHFRDCRKAVEARFPTLPHPVLSSLTGSLLADAASGCVILGLRQPHHVEAAALVGSLLTQEDADWVRSLYRGEA